MSTKHPFPRFVLLPGLIVTLVVIMTVFGFKPYVLIVNYFDGKLPPPDNFGNYPHVIKILTDQGKKDTFRFAFIGDTKSEATFERIAEQLRPEKLDFPLRLGAVAFMARPPEFKDNPMIKAKEGKMSFPRTGPLLCEYISKNRRRLIGALFLLSALAMVMENPHWFGTVGGEEAIAVIGWMLVSAGIVVRLWAALYLAGHKNEQLITQGPYELDRNPLYAGNLLSVMGLAILSESVVAGLIIFSGTLLIYYATIRYEESKLSRIFGRDYGSYQERVPRLLPRLDDIRHLPENNTVHRVSNRNIHREFFRGLRTLGVAFAIHLAAEMIEYLHAANLLHIL
jgi:protein-S-isoprenylcysteine O-methyltransferase Ste14